MVILNVPYTSPRLSNSGCCRVFSSSFCTSLLFLPLYFRLRRVLLHLSAVLCGKLKKNITRHRLLGGTDIILNS